MIPNGNIKDKLLGLAKDNPGVRGAAGVVYKGRLITWGLNSMKTHPIMLNGAYREGQIHMHAETGANRLMPPERLSEAELWVVRVLRDGTPALPNPAVGVSLSGGLLRDQQHKVDGMKNVSNLSWEPIETAPKDGTTVWLCWFDEDGFGPLDVCPMSWGHIQRNPIVGDVVGMWVSKGMSATWCDAFGGGPTHWANYYEQ